MINSFYWKVIHFWSSDALCMLYIYLNFSLYKDVPLQLPVNRQHGFLDAILAWTVLGLFSSFLLPQQPWYSTSPLLNSQSLVVSFWSAATVV